MVILGMRNTGFANNQIYHIFNRGTDKRKIFLSNSDCKRFLKNMSIFNTTGEVPRHLERIEHSVIDSKKGQPLVDVLCFCLMPNHFHLMVRQRAEGGISKYLHRLQMGYSKYFNLKNERSGNLFQGAYKAVRVQKTNQFQYLPLYIHMNPLDLVEPAWEERGIRDIRKAMKFLEEYSWSSLKTYIAGTAPSYLETKTLSALYASSAWRAAIIDWLDNPVHVHHREMDKGNYAEKH